ncbi:hypothetical protein GMMP15_2120004 [Candidatus Magnetomoraceae bacterium gMMP-15]
MDKKEKVEYWLDYKTKLSKNLNKQNVNKYFKKTDEVYKWLKSQIT